MKEIVLDDKQAEIVLCAEGEVAVRDRRGRLLGHVHTTPSDAEAAIIDEAKRRLASDQPRYTTAQRDVKVSMSVRVKRPS